MPLHSYFSSWLTQSTSGLGYASSCGSMGRSPPGCSPHSAMPHQSSPVPVNPFSPHQLQGQVRFFRLCNVWHMPMTIYIYIYIMYMLVSHWSWELTLYCEFWNPEIISVVAMVFMCWLTMYCLTTTKVNCFSFISVKAIPNHNPLMLWCFRIL